MNSSNIHNSMKVFLINEAVRAVKCIYESDLVSTPPKTIFKTFDDDIEVDDLVVVQTDTRHGFTVVKVVEVDVEVDFQDKNQDIKWLVGKVDMEQHDDIVKQEQEALETIRKAELRQTRKALSEALMEDNDAVKTLSIASSGKE